YPDSFGPIAKNQALPVACIQQWATSLALTMPPPHCPNPGQGARGQRVTIAVLLYLILSRQPWPVWVVGDWSRFIFLIRLLLVWLQLMKSQCALDGHEIDCDQHCRRHLPFGFEHGF